MIEPNFDKKTDDLKVNEASASQSEMRDAGASTTRSIFSHKERFHLNSKNWLPHSIKAAEWVMIAFTAVTAAATWFNVMIAGG